MPKNYGTTYLYNKFPYEEKIFKFIMNAEQIPVMDSSFDDVKYEFKKRQLSPALTKVLTSKNVILLSAKDGKPINTQFRVFCCKDVRSKSNDLKVFIDVTGLVYRDRESNEFKCRNIDILIADVLNAMVTLIYHKAEDKILTVTIVEQAMDAFSSLMTHVVDYLTKISAIPSTKSKCQYLCCIYFVRNLLCRNFDTNMKRVAGKICGLSEREQDMIIASVDEEDDFINLKFFIDCLSRSIKAPSLKIDNIVDKWMFLYGSNTPFAMEYFPAFSAMLTDAYTGAYMNNQKTIEKVIGNVLVSYTKSVIEKGSVLV